MFRVIEILKENFFPPYLTKESASDGEKFVKVALFLVQQFAHQHELEKGLVGQSEAPPLVQHGLQANILREIEHVQKGLQEARCDTCWVAEGGILQSLLRKYGEMLTASHPSIEPPLRVMDDPRNSVKVNVPLRGWSDESRRQIDSFSLFFTEERAWIRRFRISKIKRIFFSSIFSFHPACFKLPFGWFVLKDLLRNGEKKKKENSEAGTVYGKFRVGKNIAGR